MKRIPYVLVFALLALSLLLPGQTAQAQAPILQPVTIAGIVTYNGMGVGGIQLRLCTPDCATPDQTPIPLVTAPDGKFTVMWTQMVGAVIEPVPGQGYTFLPPACPVPPAGPAPMFLPCSMTAYGKRTLSGTALWSGTSTPAAGVPVTLIPPDLHASPLVFRTFTDANGHYAFGTGADFDPNGLEPVAYTVNFGPAGDTIFQPASGGLVDLSAASQVYNFIISYPTRLELGVRGPTGWMAGFDITISSPDLPSPIVLVSSSGGPAMITTLMENLTYKVTISPKAGFDFIGPISYTFKNLTGVNNYAYFDVVLAPSIQGKVVYGGKPVFQTYVELQQADGARVAASLTDPNGMFFLNLSGGIPDGQYYLVVGAMDAPVSIYGAKPVPVTIAGASKKGIVISVTNYSVGIRGQITTQAGIRPFSDVEPAGPSNVPLSGVTIKVERCKEGYKSCALYKTTTTGFNGYYSLNLPAGDWYYITPSKTGYEFSSRAVPGTSKIYWDWMWLDDVSYPTFYRNPNFDAYKIYSVSGKVVNAANGKGIPGVTVRSITTYDTITLDRATLTRSDGTYTLKNVPDAGTTIITTNPLQTIPFKTSDDMPGYMFSPLTGSQTGKNFTSMANFYSISGTVTKGGLPLSGVTVRLYSPNVDLLPAVHEVVTSSTGAYRFPRVAGGFPYDLMLSKTGYSFTVGTVTPAVLDSDYHIDLLNNSMVVPFKASLTKRDISIVTSGIGTDTVAVSYRQLPSGTWKTVNVTEGSTPLLGLYQVYAYEFKPVSSKYMFNPAVVTLPAGMSAGVNLSAVTVFKVSGTVKVQNKAVAGALIETGTAHRPAVVKTSTYGKYSLQALAGTAPVLQLTHKYFSFAPVTAPLLDADKTVDVLNSGSVVVTGRVVRSTGAGLGGVTVCAKSPTVCAVTNAQGYYYLPVSADAGVNLWAFTVKPKLTGKTFSPSFRPVSPTYGKSSKNFVAAP